MTTFFRAPAGRLAGLGRLLVALLLAGSAWSAVGQALGPVDKAYFGLVMSRSQVQHPWPTVPFGSWRLWDAYVTWPNLEPRRGEWDFATLDRLVVEAQAHDVKPLLVLAHSPAWASARPDERNAYKPGMAAEPARMDDWRNYVRMVGQRYRGRISEYQVWNEPSDKGHFTGTPAQLVALTCEARRVLKAIDPAITLVSPASAGGGRHIKYLDEFLAAGGAQCVDVVAHHFYVPRFGPEAMVPLIREVKQVMARRGVGHLPLWNTEVGWWLANTDGSPDHDMVAKGGWRKLDADREAGAVMARTFLLSRAEGVARLYWYAWTNNYGWGLTSGDGRPKPATAYWTRTFDAMLGHTLGECSSGPDFQTTCALSGKPGGWAKATWRDPDALVRREGPRPGPLDEAYEPRYTAR